MLSDNYFLACAISEKDTADYTNEETSFRRKTNIWFSFKVFFPRDKQADTSRRRYPSGGLSNSSDIDGL